MDYLNNRELALSIWLLIFIIFVFILPKMKEIRQSIKKVLNTFFSKTIITIFVLMIVYIILMVIGLHKIGLWESHQLKNTIIWAISFGTLSLLKINSIKKDNHFFKNTVLDNLKLIAFIQFVVEFYTFNLIIEFILVPIYVIIGGMLGIAQTDKKYKVVEKMINMVFVAFGIIVIFYSINMLVKNFGDFAIIQTIYDFYVPPLLTIMYLPFIFIMMVYMAYENIYIRLQYFIKNKKLIRFTKLYLVYKFHFRIKRLERWASILHFQDTSSRLGIINSINLIFKIFNVEKNPPKVLPEKGWSPFEAKNFLNSEGVETSYYNPLGKMDWGASSVFIDIGDDVFTNKISFYIEGNETTVNSLKIILSIFNSKSAKIAHAKLLSSVKTLLKAALDFDITKEIEMAILKGKNQNLKIGSFTAAVEKNEWSQKQNTNYDIKFTLYI